MSKKLMIKKKLRKKAQENRKTEDFNFAEGYEKERKTKTK